MYLSVQQPSAPQKLGLGTDDEVIDCDLRSIDALHVLLRRKFHTGVIPVTLAALRQRDSRSGAGARCGGAVCTGTGQMGAAGHARQGIDIWHEVSHPLEMDKRPSSMGVCKVAGGNGQ